MESDEGRAPGVVDHLADEPLTGRGYLTGPELTELPVEYAVVGGRAIHEGCIDLGPVEQVEARTAQIDARRQLRLTTAYAGSEGASPDDVAHGIGLPPDSSMLWPGGQVAYTVDAGVPDQQRVTDAIAHLQRNTGIRFTLRTAGNAAAWPNWIDVVSNGSATSSSSAVGMQGGRQALRLADSHPWPVLVHEFLHALGLYHEQSRSDRDSFVTIDLDNVPVDRRGNFQKKPGSVDYFTYDYGSLMHYSRTAFAIDASKPTITPKQAGVTIGQRNAMSAGDRQTVAKIYERFFEKGYTGVWRAGTGRYGLWVNATWESFRGTWDQWSADGLRLADVHVRPVRDGVRYSGVFLPGSGGHALWADASWDSFRAKWDEWSRQGLRLHDVHVVNVAGQDRWTGAFLAGSGGHGLWAAVPWESFEPKWREWSAQGLRLHDLHVHQVGGQDRYTGVFLPGSGAHALWVNASWQNFVAKWEEFSRQGLRLVDVNLHRVGSDTRFSGVFGPGQDGYALWANVTWESFRAKWEELAGQGLRLVDFEQVNPPAGALLDGADATGLPGADEIPGEFGGIVEAVEPAPGAADRDGRGGARLEGRVVMADGVDPSGVLAARGPGHGGSGDGGSGGRVEGAMAGQDAVGAGGALVDGR